MVCVGESASGHDTQASALHQAPVDDACPHYPKGVTPDGHDHACVSCPCHAPLAALPVQPVYAPTITGISATDILQYLPEVYLPRFVPPQLHA
jgi:hypothetical protein